MSKKMTQKELQQMLDSFQKEVTKKDWEIDRDNQIRSISSDGGKVGGATNRKTGHIQSLAGHAGKTAMEKRRKNGTLSEHQSNAGKKGGKASSNSDKFALNNTTQCPHCKSNVSLGNMKRWHGDKCWAKDLDLVEVWNKFIEEKWSTEGLAKHLGVSKGPFRTWIISMKNKNK